MEWRYNRLVGCITTDVIPEVWSLGSLGIQSPTFEMEPSGCCLQYQAYSCSEPASLDPATVPNWRSGLWRNESILQ